LVATTDSIKTGILPVFNLMWSNRRDVDKWH